MLDVGVAPAGTGAPHGNRSKGVNGRVLNTITPETNTTCMYFWSLVRNYNLRDQSLTTQLREANAKIFVEDQAVVEAQQRAINELPTIRCVPSISMPAQCGHVASSTT